MLRPQGLVRVEEAVQVAQDLVAFQPPEEGPAGEARRLELVAQPLSDLAQEGAFVGAPWLVRRLSFGRFADERLQRSVEQVAALQGADGEGVLRPLRLGDAEDVAEEVAERALRPVLGRGGRDGTVRGRRQLRWHIDASVPAREPGASAR